MKLYELIYKDEYTSVSAHRVFELDIKGISSDSREISEGCAFVALGGIHTDGALYAADAQRRGAVVCICERAPMLCSLPYVCVKNARVMLSFMLHRFWGRAADKMKLYALTGTNGKTSTAAFLKQIFISAGVKTGIIGTLKAYVDNDRICLGDTFDRKMATMTTPDPEVFYKMIAKMYESGVTHVILEASSHALKLDKLAPLRFSASAFLNFSSDHLDFHLDSTDYLLSKCKIFSMSDKVYVNIDDCVCRAAARVFETQCATYSAKDKKADFSAKNIQINGCDGISYDISYKDKSVNVSSSIFGEFTVYNTLAAASVALSEGICAECVADGIASIKAIDGRLERVPLPTEHRDISVFIDYAHTEKAMEELLRTVRASGDEHRRIVTLFGCGGERDREKRAPMARVAFKYSDFVIITEDNSRGEDPDSIIEDIMQGIDREKPYKIIKNRRSAINFAIKNAVSGDIILLVGKGHEQYEITRDGILPFSEKEAVYEGLKQREKDGIK